MERKLDSLKKEYKKLADKYKLPSFQQLNEEFGIERIAEQETETMLREIRKVVMDKVLAYLRFIEMIINPSQAPMFFFALLKGLDAADKKVLDELYSKLGKIEIEVIEIDNNYSEAGEAEFVKYVYNEWQGIKNNMKKISKSLKSSWDKKCEKKERSYLD